MPDEVPCATCGGKGRTWSQMDSTNDGKTCRTCGGSGKVKPKK